jgi:hypothetical protein
LAVGVNELQVGLLLFPLGNFAGVLGSVPPGLAVVPTFGSHSAFVLSGRGRRVARLGLYLLGHRLFLRPYLGFSLFKLSLFLFFFKLFKPVAISNFLLFPVIDLVVFMDLSLFKGRVKVRFIILKLILSVKFSDLSLGCIFFDNFLLFGLACVEIAMEDLLHAAGLFFLVFHLFEESVPFCNEGSVG